MEWESETGLYLERSGTPVIEWTFEKGWPVRWEMSESYDPQTGQFTSRRGSSTRDSDGLVFNLVNPRAAKGNNPWSAGKTGRKLLSMLDYGVHIRGEAMQKGTVKFFNEAKGFGRGAGGGQFSTLTRNSKQMKDSVIQNIR
jgi:hypothetical protein